MNSLREKLQRFMYGRYGTDKFNSFLMAAALVLLVLSWFFGRIFFLLAIVALGYAYFRMFSKDYAKRSAENSKYMSVKYKVHSVFSRYRKMWSQRKHTDFINVQIVNSRFVFRKVMEEYRLHVLSAEQYLKKQHKGKINVWLCAH